MNVVFDAFQTIGLTTLLLVVITGGMMGFYLASINGFVRVRSLRRSLITNVVAATSFMYPIAMQREFTSDSNLSWSVWLAMWVLMLVFTTMADVANWLFCRISERK